MNTNVGILYPRNPKSASSTLVGVLGRIITKYGGRLNGKDGAVGRCRVKHDHINGKMYGTRDRRKSFLLTSIRDPTARAISRVFFSRVAHGGKEPTDKMVLSSLLNHRDGQRGTVGPGLGGFQVFYTSPTKVEEYTFYDKEGYRKESTAVLRPDLLLDYVNNIVDNYDFIVVSDRIDESLVALQFIMGLDSDDILYSSSKASGGYVVFDMPKGDYECKKVPKSFISDAVRKFLDSHVWTAMNYGDIMLHAAAERSLNLTIETIGRERFKKALETFRALKREAELVCAPHITLPCSAEGILQQEKAKENCFYKDMGCGNPCFNKFMANKTQSIGA
eukprot:CAMPEP_0194291382 /NCGR_PEP_ID=MMETSP0169-20130528/43246_1 /TAXON_ID=218684 /ORGANISM="Corethron pennatum, Strain L29A3" /LENGTH=333 /DNA_ID=CAMNT_0039039245 /DNA_START=93 /DNA_END=1094 /DNA_ORIENTATION=+